MPSCPPVPCRLSKHGSLKSHEELELPSELTEDWATMEVCVDCKTFITDIIASSKHSLSLATKRARLKRKTQSFYMSSPKGREEYRPSERTIKEIWNSSSLYLWLLPAPSAQLEALSTGYDLTVHVYSDLDLGGGRCGVCRCFLIVVNSFQTRAYSWFFYHIIDDPLISGHRLLNYFITRVVQPNSH